MLTLRHFHELLCGSLSEAQSRQLLSALRPDAINESEFCAIVAQLQDSATADFDRLRPYGATAIDCCGTGGSGLPRFNTSTAVAFVAATAGVKVAKFGNRAASSKSGSFDVLDCLGIPASVDGDLAERLLADCNVVFLFAPQVYPALARLAPIRRSIQQKTVLNFVGPLLNPVHPARRLVGVSDRHMKRLLASFLAARSQLSCVVHADCGLDEICPGCSTEITAVGTAPVPPELLGTLTRYQTGQPCDVGAMHGIAPTSPSNHNPAHNGNDGPEPAVTSVHTVKHDGKEGPEAAARSVHQAADPGSGGREAALPALPTARHNAQVMLKLFDGAGDRDRSVDNDAYELVCLNAAATLLIAGRCATFAEAAALVQELLAGGKVKDHYNKVVSCYAKHAK